MIIRYLTDTLQNFVTGLGKLGVDTSKSVEHVLYLLDRGTLENMYRGDWLARAICDAPADDMTREWRAWQANQQQIEKIEEVEKTLDLQRKVKDWIIKARLYGGAAIVIGVDDGNDPSQPLDLERCKAGCLRYAVVLHRWELNAGPRIFNVADPYYSRPAYYTVVTPMYGFEGGPGVVAPVRPRPAGSNVVPLIRQPAYGSYSTVPTNIIGGMSQIHPSRVIELPGNDLPDWRLAPMGGGWGDSVLQTVTDTLNDTQATFHSTAAMVSDGKMDVIKIPDMALNMANPAYRSKLIDRFTLSTQTKSVISALLIDKEEEWQRINTQFSGLPMILHEFLTWVSGAARIPVSILFGQAYGRGMEGGSTGGGAGDARAYYDRCSSIQKNDLAPRMGMLDQVLLRSALGSADPNIYYDWNPLWQLSDAEKADIAKRKAETTQIYFMMGIMNEDALREGVVNQLIEDGTYPGLDDAIEEYGAEPEEPTDVGGFLPGGGAPALPGQASPNPQEIGASGGLDARLLDADWNEEDHPRGEGGKFTSGGGGGAGGEETTGGGGGGSEKAPINTSPLSKDYSGKSELKNGVVHTSSVDDAARALHEGRRVELDQPKRLSTLIDKLGAIAKDAIAKGQDAPKMDLCNVSVKGTNLFCADTKGIPRIQMPQLAKEQAKDFRDFLRAKGYKVKKEEEKVRNLRATQNEIDGAKVAKISDKADAKGEDKTFRRLFISKDDYILDGHHHWAAKVGRDARDGKLTDKMKVARVNIGISQLLREADLFTGGKGKKGMMDRERRADDGIGDEP